MVGLGISSSNPTQGMGGGDKNMEGIQKRGESHDRKKQKTVSLALRLKRREERGKQKSTFHSNPVPPSQDPNMNSPINAHPSIHPFAYPVSLCSVQHPRTSHSVCMHKKPLVIHDFFRVRSFVPYYFLFHTSSPPLSFSQTPNKEIAQIVARTHLT